MISVSIVALSTLLSFSDATPPSVMATATTWIPHITMPAIHMPKVRLPRLPKRGGVTEAVELTERRLKALVGDQEAWYADHGRYGSNAYTVAGNKTRVDSTFSRVSILVLYAGKRGWTAMATHPDAPGKSCVIYVGYQNTLPMALRTRANALQPEKEGQAVCDR
jgi:hypothetical protein